MPFQRRHQRDISAADIEQVLKTGRHEARNDVFKDEHLAWNYSIRGKSIDERNLRIVVSFEDPHMLVITVIHVEKVNK